MIPINHFLILSVLLLSLGLAVIFTKKNAIFMLIGVELILNAANINLIAFNQYDPNFQGQVFALFIITIAVAESAVALAIILQLYKHYNTSNLNEISNLGE